MTITLDKTGKRYRTEWIFRGLTYSFQSGQRYAVLGPNGSGKSTLLKILSGHLSPSKGAIAFLGKNNTITPENIYQHVSYAAPYIELIEEFTLEEALRFHEKMKPLLPGFTAKSIYDLLLLPRTKDKALRYFSSGMKQRVKLALALCSDVPAVILDEPATNLDVQGIEWYKNLINTYAADRLLVIGSNDPHDAAFCPNHIQILDYK